MKMPVVFLSHGAPTIALEDSSDTRAWRQLATELPRPAAILVISAHWDTHAPAVSATPAPETIHDFFGFPRELYQLRYPAPGAPELASQVMRQLSLAGLSCDTDVERGLDHGAWVPLKWMYPEADIPVTQLSVQSHLGARHHLQIGRALAALRESGVLLLASGGIVHNLRELEWHLRGSHQPTDWANTFNEWIAERVESGDVEELVEYRRLAPAATRAHPTEEHFDPFFVALGAGGPSARRLSLGFDLGTLGMDGYVFAGELAAR